MDALLHSPIIAFLALATSIAFTTVAAAVPPNAGNLVAGIFLSSMAAYLGGEEVAEGHEMELEDADI
jgi:uncharacterized membrane protein